MSALIQEFDHFVVPVDDLVAAEEFYDAVFGSPVALTAGGSKMRFGLNVKQRQNGTLPHTFFDFAGKRVGVYLQSESRPVSARRCRYPEYSLAATAMGLANMMEALVAENRAFRLEDENASGAKVLLFDDPAGNHFRVVASVAEMSDLAYGAGRICGIGDLRLEAPNLETAVDFYQRLFDLPRDLDGRAGDAEVPEASLRLPSGQRLIFGEVAFEPKGLRLDRAIPGPHLAFYVPYQLWDRLMRRLDECQISHGDRGAKAQHRPAKARDTYINDPSGYVLQLISDSEKVA